MAFTFLDAKTRVNALGDGRTFAADRQARWANSVRQGLATDPIVAGIRGFYFLYKEATVKDGSVAQQAKYAVPDDFVDDLNVFYNGTLLVKSPPGILDITQDTQSSDDSTSDPQWVRLLGVEFELIPKPPETGDEIKLLYNGFPDEISSSNNDAFTDYFLNHFFELHVYGMAEQMALEMGGSANIQFATIYGQKFQQEQQRLMLHNRRWHFKNAKLRLQNWDEYEEQKRIVFPQFQET